MKGNFNYILISATLSFLFCGLNFSLAQSENLFDKSEILHISLNGELLELLNNRTGKAEYYHITLSYQKEDSSIVDIPIRSRTRGNFRRMKDNCVFPPLYLNFSDKHENGIFSSLDRIKLVMPCKEDKYVLREYHVYKLYNLISPKSFRARLVSITLNDPGLRPRERGPFYGLLLEEEERMAERNHMVPLKQQLVRPEQTVREDFLKMAVFEYLIGNTDWSVQYRQNVKLITADSSGKIYTVPYDFDHAGIVGAPYAKPAPELKLATIKDRRYRGYCIENMAYYDDVIAHYNELKESIYAVYTESDLLDPRYVKSTVKYLDGFFKVLDNPRTFKREFQYPCNPGGTGNVVIKGLKD